MDADAVLQVRSLNRTVADRIGAVNDRFLHRHQPMTSDFAAMNAVYEMIFGPHPPARTTVEAARLPKDSLVEIDAIALD